MFCNAVAYRADLEWATLIMGIEEMTMFGYMNAEEYTSAQHSSDLLLCCLSTCLAVGAAKRGEMSGEQATVMNPGWP